MQQHDAALRKERDRYKEMFEAAVADRRLFEAESLMLMEEWFEDRQTSRNSTEVRSNHAATHITASTQPCCHTHSRHTGSKLIVAITTAGAAISAACREGQ